MTSWLKFCYCQWWIKGLRAVWATAKGPARNNIWLCNNNRNNNRTHNYRFLILLKSSANSLPNLGVSDSVLTFSTPKLGKGFGEARREECSRGKNRAVTGPIQGSSQGPFYPIIHPWLLHMQCTWLSLWLHIFRLYLLAKVI